MKHPRTSEFFFKDTIQTIFTGKEQPLGCYISDLSDMDLNEVMMYYSRLLRDCMKPALEEEYEALPMLRERFSEIDELHPSLFFATHALYYLFGAIFVSEEHIKLKEISRNFDENANNLSIMSDEVEKNTENIGRLFNAALDIIKNTLSHCKQMLDLEIRRLTEYQEKESYKALKPEQRLYFLNFCTKNSPFVHSTRHSKMRFITTNTAYLDLPIGGGKFPEDYIIENDISLVQVVELPSLEELIYFELHHLILQDVPVLKCKYCKRYFVPQGRKNVKYCDKVAENETKPCNEIGATRVYKARVDTSQIKQNYTKAYKRVIARKRSGLRDDEFDKWSVESRKMRQKCIDGEITLAELNTWLGNDEIENSKENK